MRTVLLALLLVSAAFYALPDIDLAIARSARVDGAWLFESWPGMVTFNSAFNRATHGFSALLALTALLLAVQAWRHPQRPRQTLRQCSYLLVVIALGPGLLVNAVLKDHWGRPRPAQLAEFGGSAAYVPVWQTSDACRRNCSFVSGHVAFASLPVAGAWMARTPRNRRRWLFAGIASGLLMGLCRIGLGRHFFSDTLIAIVLVTLVAALVARLLAASGSPADSGSGTMQDAIQRP
ncbi:MAG: phosphatase PAP2 family protein [Betaproteobacteria bacterium]|nr:phosphatase PAP2 family protein [Betaproteobacteria bacterium]